MRRILTTMVAAVLTACGGGGDGGPTVVPVARVTLSETSVALAPGASVTLTATARDEAGAVISGRAASWTSSNANVASVAAGLVTAVASGSATITATIDGKSASAEVTVIRQAASVRVTAPAATVDVGQTLTLAAAVLDGQGSEIPNQTVVWGSSNDAIASVSATGVVTGRAPGSVTIQATSGSVSGTIQLTIRPVGGGTLAISGITPATLIGGSTATITGTGFSATPAENLVTIGGAPVTVTAATGTELTVLISGVLPCQSSGTTTVSVTSPFGSASRQHVLQTAVARTLAVGEVLLLNDGVQLECNELVNGGRYIMSVVNTAPAPSSSAFFELRGLAVATADAPAPVVARQGISAAAPARARTSAANDWRVAHAREHARIRELDQTFLRAMGSPRRARSSSSIMNARGMPVKLTVGARDTLKVVDISRGSCTTFETVPSRVVYVGPRAVVLEADDSPLAGQMDEDYVELGREFEEKMFPILTENFGNPLAYDTQTDNNQRVVMFFTRKVNDIGPGLLGYVFSCDFFPSTVQGARGSNEAEIFYARVPTTQTSNYTSSNERAVWKWRMRATLIHEAKHLASYAERFATPIETGFEQSWLEEGTAQIAEELFGRTFWGTTWKSNTPYAPTVHCDLTPNPTVFPECPSTPPLPHAIGDHMAFLYDYALAHETLSYLSSGSAASHIYGSAWAFVRWAIDHYAQSESQFLKALTQEFEASGVQNVELRTGRPFAEMAALFAIAMATDDQLPFTPPATAKYTFPSWNLSSIWAGFVTDFRNRAPYTTDKPFSVRSGALSGFTSGSINVAGSAAAVFDLTGAAARSLLEIRQSPTSQLPAGTPLKMAILRVQ